MYCLFRPCISCGCACSRGKKVFKLTGGEYITETEFKEDFNESVWCLRPYYNWYRKENNCDETVVRLDHIKPFLVVCDSCRTQLKSHNEKIRWKRNLVKNNFNLPPYSSSMGALSKFEKRVIALVQPFAR